MQTIYFALQIYRGNPENRKGERFSPGQLKNHDGSDEL